MSTFPGNNTIGAPAFTAMKSKSVVGCGKGRKENRPESTQELADETRLRTLRLIAEQPRSTQELAPLVSLSEAALSKHLRLLAEAGILEAERTGYYVLYR